MSPRQSSALTLEHVLLALLDRQPMHGYELYQELCAMKGISRIWNIKQALLYAILDKLEERGLVYSRQVQGEGYPPRKYFHLTESGKNSLQTWIKTPVRRARDMRQEFLAKLIIVRRYGSAELLALIRAQQQICAGWLAELDENIPLPDEAHLDDWLVYSFRSTREEAVLKWLRQLEADVSRLNDPDANLEREV